jgi:hypothetical protein
LLESLRDALGVGAIRVVGPRKDYWKPLAVYTVNSLKAHWRATIPFFETYLLPCAKRVQFDAWRDSLERYVNRYNIRCGRGRSLCSVVGCGRPVRGRGLCRSHYHRATGW